MENAISTDMMVSKNKSVLENESEICQTREVICSYLSEIIRPFLQQLPLSIWKNLQEIRLRIGQPITLILNNGCFFLNETKLENDWRQCVFRVASKELNQTVLLISHHSFYALEQEFQHGFVTIPGGHRIGLAGKGVIKDGHIQTLKYISSLNIRIARNLPGVSLPIMPYLWEQQYLLNTLFIGPPGCGKTTLLRDVAKNLSEGWQGHCLQVGVIDERSEIGACFLGVPQLNVGACTDILDGVPKSVGMEMFLRVMGHAVMITDEISTAADSSAILDLCGSGVGVIASAHGSNLQSVLCRESIAGLLQAKAFQRYMILSKRNGVGTVEAIYNGQLQKIWEDG